MCPKPHDKLQVTQSTDEVSLADTLGERRGCRSPPARGSRLVGEVAEGAGDGEPDISVFSTNEGVNVPQTGGGARAESFL